MYQLHLGIGDDMERSLRSYAAVRGITIAAAVRILLHQVLAERAAAEQLALSDPDS